MNKIRGCHCGQKFMSLAALKLHRRGHPKKPRDPAPVKLKKNGGTK